MFEKDLLKDRAVIITGGGSGLGRSMAFRLSQLGAKVFVTAGGTRQRQDVISGGSYCSSSDLRLHFGFGGAKRIDKLEIQWPDGAKEIVAVPGINRVLMINEGKGVSDRNY